MIMARLLLAVLGALQGWHAQGQVTIAPIVIAPTTPAPVPATTPAAVVVSDATTTALATAVPTTTASATIYPDQEDPNCVAGQSCSTGTLVPTVRGLCVTTGGGNWCWDSCNLKHAVTSYSTANQAGIALMVKQLRTGMRYGSCPGASFTPTCNPGERCTPAGSTWGRGMCTTQVGAGNQCLDMCNTKISLATFHDTPGKQAGTVSIVQMVRAGRDPAGLTTCPMSSVWVWLWFPLLLCCAIGGCAVAFYMFNFYRTRLKRGNNKGYREPEQPYVEDGAAPYVDYDQNAPQDQDFQQDYQQDPQQDQGLDQTYYQEGQEDPMPVVDQTTYGGEVAAAPSASESNMFEQPNLMGALAVPMTSNPVTYQPSMSVNPAQGYTTTYAGAMPQYTSQVVPQYTSQMMPQYTSQVVSAPAMTMQPQYAAYGSYGAPMAMAAPAQTVYPGTTSMRIG